MFWSGNAQLCVFWRATSTCADCETVQRIEVSQVSVRLDFGWTTCLDLRVFSFNYELSGNSWRSGASKDAVVVSRSDVGRAILGIPPGIERRASGMPSGTIARLLIDKGFGFIRDESGIEHFFHRSSVRGAVFELLREGQRVDFTPEDSGKGPRAGDVRLIEG